jgi:DNA-binding NtrC family response regulator
MNAIRGNFNKSKRFQIIGKAYKGPKSLVERYAKRKIPILLVGETGSGKKVFAKHYMKASEREETKWRTFICTGTTDELLHSTVFGHVKGAFTGAQKDRDGFIQTCRKGVLFLDELGDASERFQSAILRVVEGNSYSRVGDDKEIWPEDVVIIAATNKPESIRDELKFRFNTVYIPPLQKSDIPALATYFLQQALNKKNVFPKEKILVELMARDYPGNVRELSKICGDLLVKRDEDIMSEKIPPITSGELGAFDYQRFEREIEAWHKYIQPLVEKYGLDFFKYRYFRSTAKSFNKDIETATFQFPSLIEKLQKGIETENQQGRSVELVAQFKDYLEKLFRGQTLPKALKFLGQFLNHKNIVSDQPDIASLVLLPMKTAVKQFKVMYMYYHLKRNSTDLSAAAKAAGLSKTAFKQRLDRARKKDE